MTKSVKIDEKGMICGFTAPLDDAAKCKKCGGELEVGFVWDKCKQCGELQGGGEHGIKHDSQKPRMSLVPQAELWQVVKVLEFGAAKYSADNWRYVDNARVRYFDAAQRHIQAWWQGETIDNESGLPHLAHAICCLFFLMALGGDDA